MPPELFPSSLENFEAPPCSASIDVYSVCLVIYEVQAGERVSFYPGIQQHGIIRAKMGRQPPRLNQLAHLTDTMWNVILRGVSSEEADRPDLEEIEQAIEASMPF